MIFLFYLFIFLFGSAIGSFLNVVICRLASDEGIVKKRSHCPKCGQILVWYDLIPIISFFILRARCRSCKEKISWQYPLVEAATGALFVGIFNFQFSISNEFSISNFQILNLITFCYLLIVVCCLIIIFVYDLRHYLIPDKVLFPAIGAMLAYRIFIAFANFNPPSPLLEWGGNAFTPLVKGGAGGLSYFGSFFLSAFVAAAFFLFLVLITRGRGMGIGDIKLSFLLGLILGWPQILIALFLAFFMGAVIGIFMIYGPPASAWLRQVLNFLPKNSSPAFPIFGANWKKTMKSKIPFGPFLIASALIALFWGQQIINWYRGLFL